MGTGNEQTTDKGEEAERRTMLTQLPSRRHKPAERPSSGANGSFMLLPDELLLDIFEMATPGSIQNGYLSHTYHYVHFLDIAKTCRRFYRIVLPLMYHRFSLSVGHHIITRCVRMPLEALRLLGRSLRENPSLGSYCKKIWLRLEHPRIPEGEPWDDIHLTDLAVDPDVLEEIQLTKDLAGLLTGVEDLTITGGFHHYQHVGVWDIVATAAARMPELHELSLCHWSQPVPEVTGPLLKCTALSTSLKRLEAERIADHDSPLDKVANVREIFIPPFSFIRVLPCAGSSAPILSERMGEGLEGRFHVLQKRRT